MIRLPILHSLDVSGYGLYPGRDPDTPGLHINFAPGLTLVLGTNGLGKTTLVTMLYRLLTGPYDIPVLSQDRDLGQANLEPRPLRPNLLRAFAQRVSDNAANASARLVFHIGGEEVTVERDLRNLALRSFKVGDSAPRKEEAFFQEQIVRLANISAFSDWILLLRYMVFYFEDRRSLVWDPTAQRQLLRILFLEPNSSRDWAQREREILEADTRVRNLRAVTTREERSFANDEALIASEPDIRQLLKELEPLQRDSNESLEQCNFELSDVESNYEAARLQFLTLQQRRESQYRAIERARLRIVNDQLPRFSDSARYILVQLLTGADCLVCGNNVPSVREAMEARIDGSECIVCGSHLSADLVQWQADSDGDSTDPDVRTLEDSDLQLEAARDALQQAEDIRNPNHHQDSWVANRNC